MLLFAIGAVIMRGAGCIINDLWDRDIDARVERTRQRPLASGAVTLRQAIIFLVVLLLCGLSILVAFPTIVIVLGCLSLVPVVLYPLAKRFTWYPQVILGLTFNFGILMGGAAIAGAITFETFLLYISALFWTTGYDTIYAHQDIVDDGIVGVKSTARRFGDRSPFFIGGFYTLFVAILYVLGFMTSAGALFYILWAGVALHLLWQIWHLDIMRPDSCLALFKSNRIVGFAVFMLYALGYVSLI